MSCRSTGIMCLVLLLALHAAGCKKQPAETTESDAAGGDPAAVALADVAREPSGTPANLFPQDSKEDEVATESPATIYDPAIVERTPPESEYPHVEFPKDLSDVDLDLPFDAKAFGSDRPNLKWGPSGENESAEPGEGPEVQPEGENAPTSVQPNVPQPSPNSTANSEQASPSYPATGYATVPAPSGRRVPWNPTGPAPPPTQIHSAVLPGVSALPSASAPAASSAMPRVAREYANAAPQSPSYSMPPAVAARAPSGGSAPLPHMPASTPYFQPSPRPLYPAPGPSWHPGPRGESYDEIDENPFRAVRREPLSTFAVDVDTASYANVRRYLDEGRLPPADAVRMEELVNYFDYDYPEPEGEDPFSVDVQVAPCPWDSEHRLARIGIKGRDVKGPRRVPCNLVFLIDVSGSMDEPNKLQLLKTGLRMLVHHLSDRDRVAVVVYAGASGRVLPPTSCEDKAAILAALERLTAGGSTNGGDGIDLAYKTAREFLEPRSINRVILCTDGDFNVGVTDRRELLDKVRRGAAAGVFLTALGFGMGDLQDGTLEQLADCGNGNYAYLDSVHEARKVLVEQMGGTLVTIAKDVKIQVDFNPAHVAAYRLLGYENRVLAAEDFADDRKDAGEIGAGHTVTALYELVPPEASHNVLAAYDTKYRPQPKDDAVHPEEMMTVKLRFKDPHGDESRPLEFPIPATPNSPGQLTGDFKFAAAVACFGMLLRDSPHKGDASFDTVLELAVAGKGDDPSGYRGEFLKLAHTAKALSADPGPVAVPATGQRTFWR